MISLIISLMISRRPGGRGEIINEIMNQIIDYFFAGLPGWREITDEIINYFPPASPAVGKSLRSGGGAPAPPEPIPLHRPNGR